MSVQAPSNTVIFTDLDHTLLDARGPGPAGAAVARVRAHGIAVVPATSKTAAETIALLRGWGVHGPAVVENGAALCLPTRPGCWRVRRLTAQSYAQVRFAVRQLRREFELDMPGFGDWNLVELMRRTDLTPPRALAARMRLASEPLSWRGEPPLAFMNALHQAGLTGIGGGRFFTVLPRGADKADGAHALLRHWRPSTSSRRPRVVALGDAPNDRELLAFADLAACLPGPRPIGDDVDCLRTSRAGPEGWLEALHQLGVIG
jgi:mannosyl-3-phosphoglycerate phosphatase